ncbi:MAG: 50S ribosomal protein L18 [bacterium]
MSLKDKKKRAGRLKRKRSLRKKLNGSAERPRVSVYRSNRNIYAQLVNDDHYSEDGQHLGGLTLAASSSKHEVTCDVPEEISGKCATAYQVGRALADKAKERGVDSIVFDRSGYLYHGRVAALARGLRDGGIKF